MSSTSAISLGCPHCGGIHQDRTCPRIKAVEYHPDGSIKRIEFHEPMIGFQLPGWANAPVPTGGKP